MNLLHHCGFEVYSCDFLGTHKDVISEILFLCLYFFAGPQIAFGALLWFSNKKSSIRDFLREKEQKEYKV